MDRSVLRPLTTEAATFFFSGGDIFWLSDKPSWITPETAMGLRKIFSVEARAFYREGDLVASAHAVKMWCQLTKAIDQYINYVLACRGPKAAADVEMKRRNA